jgi:membrane glycosyltransferase
MSPLEKLTISWNRTASWRRILLIVLVLLPTFVASRTMSQILPHKGGSSLEIVLVVIFAILFAWISIGFWTALLGFFVLLRGKNRLSVTEAIRDLSHDIPDEGARTAILIPIYNEDVDRVMAGVRTTFETLAETGQGDRFDIFILSDSTNPDVWVMEEEAWYRLCASLGAFGRIFYRRRRSNIKRKSGNVADFCRRWGKNYRYMIVFDADSIMDGETMVRIVQIMERRPDIGILQTPPAGVNRETLIARAQQFANHVYGPMFAAGLHWWQLGDAQYWGHNAIIRVEPFMRHCELPRLPGGGPLGGDILSHDFVESALMRRAGYGVWLAYDLRGSYEETPPTLIDELKRDRRWCQGNLQHMRLLFTRGFFPAHRALFINGIMSYGSALLWLLFLAVSSAEAIAEVLFEPKYFPGVKTLFPEWPVWYPHWAITLLASTAVVLFLPKLLSILLAAIRGELHLYGGAIPMTAGVLLEVVLSTLLAPVRMLFHSTFVVGTLLGRSVGWGTQTRDDRGTSWADAMNVHWWGMCIGIAWGGILYLFNPTFFWWISPILLSLALSGPLSVLTSRASFGTAARASGLFLIPEETERPKVLRELDRNMEAPIPYSPLPIPRGAGFIRAVVDPRTNALHRSLLMRYSMISAARPSAPERARQLVERALSLGPGALGAAEKIEILRDPHILEELHRRVWEITDRDRGLLWGLECPCIE